MQLSKNLMSIHCTAHDENCFAIFFALQKENLHIQHFHDILLKQLYLLTKQFLLHLGIMCISYETLLHLNCSHLSTWKAIKWHFRMLLETLDA